MSKGRPHRTYTKEQIIAAIHEARGLAAVAARYLKCNPAIISRWIKACPEVAEAQEAATSHVTDLAEHALYRKGLDKLDEDEREQFDAMRMKALDMILKAKGKKRGYGEYTEQQSTAVIDKWLAMMEGKEPQEGQPEDLE